MCALIDVQNAALLNQTAKFMKEELKESKTTALDAQQQQERLKSLK